MTADTRWTRRDFLSTTALGVIGMGFSGSSAGADERFAYIGTYTNTGHSDGIYRLFLNTTTGAMRVDGVAAKSADPSFLALHPNGRVLYAVNELESFGGKPTGAVSAFAVARESGALTPLNQLPSHGKAPCYVSVDRTGHTVLVANYVSGTIATFTVRQDGGSARCGPSCTTRARGPTQSVRRVRTRTASSRTRPIATSSRRTSASTVCWSTSSMRRPARSRPLPTEWRRIGVQGHVTSRFIRRAGSCT